MGLISEFKDFINKGNVIDLAVGVVIGGAFGKIVNSLVSDIIMPPIGLLIGGVNFSEIKLTIKEDEWKRRQNDWIATKRADAHVELFVPPPGNK